MPSLLEVDVPTPPSSAGAAQVSQSWLPKAGSTLQPDPMYRQKRLALEDDAPSENAQLNTTAPGRLKASASASASGAKSARSKSAMSTATAPARRRPGGAIPRNYSHRPSIPSRRC